VQKMLLEGGGADIDAKMMIGHYWDIALPDGRHACGQVIDMAQPHACDGKGVFLAGLLDWQSDHPASASELASVPCLVQGILPVSAIDILGEGILGWRAPDAGTFPWLFREACFDEGVSLWNGLRRLCKQGAGHRCFPLLVGWNAAGFAAQAGQLLSLAQTGPSSARHA